MKTFNQLLKRFLLKVLFFILPFVLLVLLSQFTYTKSGGDLSRLGKISYPENYRDQFRKDFQQDKTYTQMSDLNLEMDHKFNLFTIGDSFSNIESNGYQVYLNANHGLDVLNFDYPNFYNIKDYNSLRFLKNILKGDLFHKIKTDYIIIEVVERNFIKRFLNSKSDSRLFIKDLKIMKPISPIRRDFSSGLSTYINDAKLHYKYRLGYLFMNKAFDSQVYKMKLSEPLFSVHDDEILFYFQDIQHLVLNNKEQVSNLNADLNKIAVKLKEFNVKLIVMPAVDKYDLYYDYIINNPYNKNLFFDYLNEEKKEYIYLDTKSILKPYLKEGVKDIFFADDTHWSPKACIIIAKEINKLLFN